MFCSHPQNTSAPLRVFAVPLVRPRTVFTWFMCFVSFKNVESSSVHWIQAMEVDIGGRDLASLALRSWLSVMNIIYSSFTHHYLIIISSFNLIDSTRLDIWYIWLWLTRLQAAPEYWTDKCGGPQSPVDLWAPHPRDASFRQQEDCLWPTVPRIPLIFVLVKHYVSSSQRKNTIKL